MIMTMEMFLLMIKMRGTSWMGCSTKLWQLRTG